MFGLPEPLYNRYELAILWRIALLTCFMCSTKHRVRVHLDDVVVTCPDCQATLLLPLLPAEPKMREK